MVRSSTLHIKINPEEEDYLACLAKERRTSKGELVREAISACYQTSVKDLPLRQRRALAAYEGGFISLGRLARVMGMHALDLRHWLQDHGLHQNSSYAEQDVGNA